jgi:hypothetical protein
LILILYHMVLLDFEQSELTQRTIDFSASDVWAASTRLRIMWRQDEIDYLRRTCTTLHVLRSISARLVRWTR